jgi:spore coat protein U-like protein
MSSFQSAPNPDGQPSARKFTIRRLGVMRLLHRRIETGGFRAGIQFVVRSASLPILATVLASAAGANPAQAQTATASFEVRITLGNECTIAVDDVNFGTFTSLTLAHDAQVSGSVTCTGISPISVEIDQGTGGSSTFATRQMDFEGETIDYNLYRDEARTEIIGDGTGGTFPIGFTSSGGIDAFTIYARTAPGQSVKPAGTYTSDLVATVTF